MVDDDAAAPDGGSPELEESPATDQKQASDGSDGPKMMSLNIRIAGGARNASRDQLDFVKEVNGVDWYWAFIGLGFKSYWGSWCISRRTWANCIGIHDD
ncbi:hypothetical protein FOZ62_016179 [Perkinsus olseni]|uniref:Uncharacterized protein n=1 Tax=Perkinsus olseni TaxID=32597 RepID=A0A7J6PY53_PEROL|nr:hypothetical protein FOZ62_016179 [Perkinsus olseni]